MLNMRWSRGYDKAKNQVMRETEVQNRELEET